MWWNWVEIKGRGAEEKLGRVKRARKDIGGTEGKDKANTYIAKHKLYLRDCQYMRTANVGY